MSMSADFSRTCEGCGHLTTETAVKGKPIYRCYAPGPNRGYSVGIKRLEPWVPAWCPLKLEGATDYGTKKR